MKQNTHRFLFVFYVTVGDLMNDSSGGGDSDSESSSESSSSIMINVKDVYLY